MGDIMNVWYYYIQDNGYRQIHIEQDEFFIIMYFTNCINNTGPIRFKCKEFFIPESYGERLGVHF